MKRPFDLSTALVQEPDIVFLDKPTAGAITFTMSFRALAQGVATD